MNPRLRLIAVVAVVLAVLFVTYSKRQTSSSPAVTATHTTETITRGANDSLRRDLSKDEAAGGHTLRKHVGKTDQQLRERLEDEPNISAASTYTDRETAEFAAGTALHQEEPRIQRWLQHSGGHPNLVLDYVGDAEHPIGRTLRRGDSSSQPCSEANVVLKWDGADEYHVLTSYPECR